MLLHVAVGILTNAAGDVLIAERPKHTYKGGLWEFPGGKIEANETVFAALQRELKEELGIHVIAAESWLHYQHDYHDRQVSLNIWHVTQFTGEPFGREGQAVRWVNVSDLSQYEFPAGNHIILTKLERGELCQRQVALCTMR